MSDDAAVLLMVDSNLQREQILPSERAFAYKMKLDALKRQGARSDLTSSQVVRQLFREYLNKHDVDYSTKSNNVRTDAE